MKLSGIVAMAKNRVIGRDGRLPWKLSADLKRFKSLTWGHFLLMGRKTFDSIGRPLPGRTSVVITRQEAYPAPEGVLVAHSLPEALRQLPRAEEAFVIGGAEIYREALEEMERLYVTRVHAVVEGDAHFPEVDWNDWRLVLEDRHEADERNEFAYSFQMYVRAGVVRRAGF